MPNALIDLATPDDFDRLLARSSSGPVIVYKHSQTCGTSAAAFEEISDLPAMLPDVPIGMVNVQRARSLSNFIASRLGVRHESPQVFIVSAGVVRWHASHFRVTADGIMAALKRLDPAPAG